MEKDIYCVEPNVKLTFPQESTEEVVCILRSIYNFREKGTHSPNTTDHVQYWYVENFGVVYALIRSVDFIPIDYNDGRRGRIWNSLNKKLKNSGIDYKVEKIHQK